jgi:hypothetical protein
VWRNVIWARLELIVGAVAVTSILLGGSLWLVHRRGDVPDAEVGGLVRRYRGRMGRAHRWLQRVLVGRRTSSSGRAMAKSRRDHIAARYCLVGSTVVSGRRLAAGSMTLMRAAATLSPWPVATGETPRCGRPAVATNRRRS